MTTASPRIAIPGSLRRRVPAARLIQRSDPQKRIRVSIYARRNPQPAAALLLKAQAIAAQPLGQRKYLTASEFEEVYGASADDLAQIRTFAEHSGLQVVDSSSRKRRVLVEGTVGQFETIFGVELNDFTHDRMGHFRAREGQVFLPPALFEVVAGIEGMDNRPSARSRRVRTRFTPQVLDVETPTALANRWPGTFFPTQLAGLYDYPTELDGKGQKFAILAFNGGGAPDPSGGYSLTALRTYFQGVLKAPVPQISDVVVQGKGNVPGADTPQSAQQGDTTGEVMLDLCCAGALAPGAHLFVYFTEFSNQGWIDALHEAISDGNGVSVISVSYGNPEDDPNGAWTTAGVNLVNQAFEAAASVGITICVASGDDGSLDQEASGAHCDFPASSPWVLAVGGTSLKSDGKPVPAIASEVVWNDLALPQPAGAGGGGVSTIFPLPEWQAKAGVPPSASIPPVIGRGVPDVAAVADPYTGVVIINVDGKSLQPIGGTSAAAPIWASLIVRLNQGLGSRLGFFNPTLYSSLASGVLNDIQMGNNGAYSAGPGWDACTGFGSPSGTRLLGALRSLVAAAPAAASPAAPPA